MKKNFRHLLALLIAVFCGLFGWWVVRDFEKSPAKRPRARGLAVTEAKPSPRMATRPARGIRRDEFRDGTTVEIFASSTPDEVILRFPSGESYGAFLFALANSNIHLVDQIDRLRAMRLSYADWADLSSLLDGENIVAYDSLPSVPAPSPAGGSAQAGLVGFGDGLLPWLGVVSDNSRWG